MIKEPFELVPLGSICDLNPRLPKDSRPADADLVSFVPMAAVDEETASINAGEIRAYSTVKKGFTPFRDNDVLFAKITPCMENGKVALARGLQSGVGFGSTEFHVLRASGRVLPEWLRYYVLRPSFRNQAKRRMSGAVGQQRVPAEFLFESLIPVPPVDEQRRLVELLSRAENIVRMRREAEQKAKEIIPALFLDMFGDPATNPKGWENAPLSGVSEISYGIATKLDSRVTGETGRRILTISNVKIDGELDLSIERFSQATDRKAASAEVKAGDLLFNWRNGSDTHIGKTAIWERSDTALHVSFLLRLRPDQGKASSLYLWALLNRLRSSGFFLSASRQQVNRKFNASELSALRVPLAPLDLQNRFASTAQELRRHAITQYGAAILGERVYQSLLTGVFRAAHDSW